MHQYQIHTSRGSIPVHVMAPERFGGEYARRSSFYCSSVWLVSALAMMTNLVQAAYRKTTRRGSFGGILWTMGRDTKHVSSLFVDRFSRYNHQAKYGAAGWRSLDLFYNYYEKVKPRLGKNIEGWVTRYWIEKLENRQAVLSRCLSHRQSFALFCDGRRAISRIARPGGVMREGGAMLCGRADRGWSRRSRSERWVVELR